MLQVNMEALCQACGQIKMKDPDFKKVVSFDHLRKCAEECTSGVRWKPSVQMFMLYKLQWTASLHRQLLNHTYKSMGFYKFWLLERGKMRYIRSVHISERCVQKCVNNYGVRPVVEPRLIYDNGASRKGKGTDFAIKRLRKHLAHHWRKYGREGGILIIDFHDYFNSVPHEPLYDLYRMYIKDHELYCLATYFIRCFGDKGLGLGSELSQISAIMYPDRIDHFIKEQLHIEGYARYNDDSYLIHQDIGYLKHCLEEIKKLLDKYGIQLNPKTRIVKFKCGSFTFLKRRFHITETGKIITKLSRKNVKHRREVLKRQKRALDKGADMASIRQSYQSWRGYADKWNSHEAVHKMDALYKILFREEGNPHVKRKQRTGSCSIKSAGKDKGNATGCQEDTQ